MFAKLFHYFLHLGNFRGSVTHFHFDRLISRAITSVSPFHIGFISLILHTYTNVQSRRYPPSQTPQSVRRSSSFDHVFFWTANRPCKYWKRKRLNTDFAIWSAHICRKPPYVMTWDTPKMTISVDMTAYRVKTDLACIKITILKRVEFKSLAFVSLLFWSISLFASDPAQRRWLIKWILGRINAQEKKTTRKFHSEAVCSSQKFLLQTQKIAKFPVPSHDVGLQLRKEFSIHD